MLMVGCSTRNAAEDEIYRIAETVKIETEGSPGFVGTQLGTAGVEYVRSKVEHYDGQVLAHEVIVRGLAQEGELLGWVDAMFTAEIERGGFLRSVTATLCLQFEIRYFEVVSHEIDCPST